MKADPNIRQWEVRELRNFYSSSTAGKAPLFRPSTCAARCADAFDYDGFTTIFWAAGQGRW